jgi:hypothetical protein
MVVMMEPIHDAPDIVLGQIDIVLTDVDDTLTCGGRLAGETLTALDRLQRTGLRVIPATAASAGWASLMVHMWPIDGVIAENGGLYFHLDAEGVVHRVYWQGKTETTIDLAALKSELLGRFPWLEIADDQAYRETCLAFQRPQVPELVAQVLSHLTEIGAGGTVNSLWLLAWPGSRDKLVMARRMLAEVFGLDMLSAREHMIYVGDSENDEAMFRFFPHSVGVATVTGHRLAWWPRWVTDGAGGDGFVEMVDRLIAARSRSHR